MDLYTEKRILTVTQLTNLVKGVLEENFDRVWVEGEVSNLAMPVSGHCYFTLKDAGAQLRCVMFRASARALKFRPSDGMGLVLRGRLSIYEQRGEYQLIVEYMEPKGMGALQMAFIQLKERLAKEGLFDEAHKKPIPLLPRRIAIVTSPTGAAVHDILNVLNRRYANLEILIYPVRVQGEGAGEEIAAAIRDLNRYKEIDVMIAGRGGGSIEDLWAFNEEVVARAIHASRIPVISAVGHEVDYTIADFVADLRAPTPSAAAELVVKSKAELSERLESLAHRLVHGMERRLSELDADRRALARSLKDPSMLLGHLGQRVDDLGERLSLSVKNGMTRREDRLDSFRGRLRLQTPAMQVERTREATAVLSARADKAILRVLDRAREAAGVNTGRLHALSPLLTLSRGYSVACRLPEMAAVKDARQLNLGDRLQLTFQRGSALCVVEDKKD